MDTGDGARKAVDGFRGTKTLDVGKHPIQNANLGNRRDESCHYLHSKEDSRWNLHIVAKFKIRCELDALRRRDVPISDENHIGNGTTREDDAADELTDQINTTVLICYSHDDAVGDEEDGSNGEGQKETIPW